MTDSMPDADKSTKQENDSSEVTVSWAHAVFRKAAGRAGRKVSAQSAVLYIGVAVLICQLVFVYAFFPSYQGASADLTKERPTQITIAEAGEKASSRDYSKPDLLQWAGAQSLVWIASLFAPETPVRMAPALVFFFVAGGFVTSIYRAAEPGTMGHTIGASAKEGMRLWLSWFAGAVILLIYLVTSAGGIEALRVAAGVTFEKSGRDIAYAFLSHWLIYIAWFAVLGFLPMLGGALLGLVRTRLLTKPLETTAEQPCPQE